MKKAESKFFKKLIAFALCVCSVMLFCSFGEADLLDGKKLIDLEKAIETAKAGGDSSSFMGETGDDEETETTGSAEENIPEAPDKSQETVYIVIYVKGESMTYNGISSNGKTPENEKELEKLMKEDCFGRNEKIDVRLKDDFAEAHAYRRILKKLRALENELGFELHYD